MDLYKIVFHQALPELIELPTVEVRVSSHMQIEQILLPDASWERDEEEQWEIEAAGAAAAVSTARGGVRLSSSRQSILKRVPVGNSSPAAAEVRRTLDTVVEEIRTMFPSQHAYVRNGGGFDRPCGTEFEAAMELLYQGRRGPLLGLHQ